MKKLNKFLFPLEDGETLHPSDFLWFYGGLAVFISITIHAVWG